MAFDPHSEIFQDFLQEAGELLESLNEQLVGLESNPGDQELLNAVFRAFHTIKGGAGFLELGPVVELCHRSEDIFGLARDGALELTERVMDPVLAALDELNAMFDALQDGVEPVPAPGVVARLEQILDPDSVTAAPRQEREGDPPREVSAGEHSTPAGSGGGAHLIQTLQADGDGEMSDDEFEALLDHLDQGTTQEGTSSPEPLAPSPEGGNLLAHPSRADGDEEMSDDEFEMLLDALQQDAPPEREQKEKKGDPAAAGREDPSPRPKRVSAPQKIESSVRVDTRRLDDVMNLVGELVLIRNRFDNLKQTVSSDAVDHAISDLNLLTTDIQMVVMRLRMQPVRKVFNRFPRVVRDLARKLERKVGLQLIGEETEVDKNLVEELADPLIHLIRNAIDHGIESPQQRIAAGKPAQGTIVLSAEQEGDHILLTIRDDGAGMNPETLRQLAVERGMVDQEIAHQLSDHALFNLIFEPGFSTRREISDLSGRGVGMDVVRTHINQLNGQIEIDSRVGEGTVISIQVPLTLAILPTLMVYIGSQNYAIPLPGIVELFEMESVEVGRVGGHEVARLRGRTYPLVHASEMLGGERHSSPEQRVLVVELGGHALALVVEQVVGQEEVVIKPLGTLLQGMPGYSGATITGDGRVALILDIAGLVSRVTGIDYNAYAEDGVAA